MLVFKRRKVIKTVITVHFILKRYCVCLLETREKIICLVTSNYDLYFACACSCEVCPLIFEAPARAKNRSFRQTDSANMTKKKRQSQVPRIHVLHPVDLRCHASRTKIRAVHRRPFFAHEPAQHTVPRRRCGSMATRLTDQERV